MAAIEGLMWRYAMQWTGGKIGTGYTNFFFTADVSTAQAAATASAQFFKDIYLTSGGHLPSGIHITFPASVDVVEPGTGRLVSTVSVTPPTSVDGSDAGVYSAPSGMCVTWLTSGVLGGHRLLGRTFIVPLGASYMQTDGTPADAAVTGAGAAATALIASAPEFVIWHRPISVDAGGGEAHPVLAWKITDKSAILTSRR